MGNAKQRVEQELAELNEKIVKLAAFLFGGDIVNIWIFPTICVFYCVGS